MPGLGGQMEIGYRGYVITVASPPKGPTLGQQSGHQEVSTRRLDAFFPPYYSRRGWGKAAGENCPK
jgi:hypothetical protein